MDGKPVKWYLSTSSLVAAFLCAGPFALPLLWINPRFGTRKKVLISALVIVASFYLWGVFKNSLKAISDYYGMLDGMLK